MFIVTRCAGESVMIGDDIKLTIDAVSYFRARMRIDSPRSVVEKRAEIDEEEELTNMRRNVR